MHLYLDIMADGFPVPSPVANKQLRELRHETSHCYGPSHRHDRAAHEIELRYSCLPTVHHLPTTPLVPERIGARRVARPIGATCASGVPDRADGVPSGHLYRPGVI